MRYLMLAGVVVSTLIGCATVTEQSKSPDHKKIYSIDCSGKAVPIKTCYDKAQSLCPNGYSTILHDAPYFRVDAATSVAMSIPGVQKGITVKCK